MARVIIAYGARVLRFSDRALICRENTHTFDKVFLFSNHSLLPRCIIVVVQPQMSGPGNSVSLVYRYTLRTFDDSATRLIR